MLATTTDLKAHLGIPASDTSKDSVLGKILAGASAFFESQTRRKFGANEYTVKLDGNGRTEIFLPQFPVVSVSKIKVGGQEISLAGVKTYAGNGILYRSLGWPINRQNIEVTFEAGYTLPADQDESPESGAPDPLPEEIEQAVIRIAARIYERRTAEGITSVSPASFSVSYRDDIDPDIKAIISKHKKFHA